MRSISARISHPYCTASMEDIMQSFETREDMMRHVVQPGDRILEVGVFRGKFAKFLRSLDPAELHLVDPFEGNLCSGNADGVNIEYIDGETAFEEVRDMFRDDARVHIHREWSPQALEKFPDDYFRAIYLDGDHTYEGSSRDLEVSFRKIRDGGYICGHDYDRNPQKCPYAYDFGVRRAVREFASGKHQKVQYLGLDGYISFAIRIDKHQKPISQKVSRCNILLV